MQVASGFRAHWLCITPGKLLIKNSLPRRGEQCLLTSGSVNIWLILSKLLYGFYGNQPLAFVWRTAISWELFMWDVQAETVKLISIPLKFDAGTEDLNQLPWLISRQMHCIFVSVLIIAITDHLLVFDPHYLSQFSEQMDQNSSAHLNRTLNWQ